MNILAINRQVRPGNTYHTNLQNQTNFLKSNNDSNDTFVKTSQNPIKSNLPNPDVSFSGKIIYKEVGWKDNTIIDALKQMPLFKERIFGNKPLIEFKDFENWRYLIIDSETYTNRLSKYFDKDGKPYYGHVIFNRPGENPRYASYDNGNCLKEIEVRDRSIVYTSQLFKNNEKNSTTIYKIEDDGSFAASNCKVKENKNSYDTYSLYTCGKINQAAPWNFKYTLNDKLVAELKCGKDPRYTKFYFPEEDAHYELLLNPKEKMTEFNRIPRANDSEERAIYEKYDVTSMFFAAHDIIKGAPKGLNPFK